MMYVGYDWEILGDAWEEATEWEAYEADLADGDPWAE